MSKSHDPNDDGEASSSYSTSTSPTTSQPRLAKSWLTRSVATLIQLPKSTPLAVLRWTTPEGPMPKIIHLPSRDKGRTIDVYLWMPPNTTSSPSSTTGEDKNAGSASHAASTSPPPISPSFTGTQRPCVIDFHGGGFVMGGPTEEAPWCAALARSGIIAVSVAYRLGPTWEFPAALHDAEDVLYAVLGGRRDDEEEQGAAQALRESINQEAGGSGRISINTDKVALSGFSSGGNVALNMLLDIPLNILKASDSTESRNWPSPFPPSHSSPIPTLLFFPSLDARKAPHERNRPAAMGPPSGFVKFIGRTLKNAYIPSDKVEHLRASPGLAPTSTIHKSTRALLILPELDTLAEQSETWVEKLDQAGIAVYSNDDETGKDIGVPLQKNACAIRVHRLKGMSHGFTTFPDAMLDVESRKVKSLVMEQARRWIITMLGGDAGSKEESRVRIEAIAEGVAPGQGVNQPKSRVAKAIE